MLSFVSWRRAPLIVSFGGRLGDETVRIEGLKFHNVGPRTRSSRHERERQRSISIVIDAGLGNDQRFQSTDL